MSTFSKCKSILFSICLLSFLAGCGILYEDNDPVIVNGTITVYNQTDSDITVHYTVANSVVHLFYTDVSYRIESQTASPNTRLIIYPFWYKYESGDDVNHKLESMASVQITIDHGGKSETIIVYWDDMVIINQDGTIQYWSPDKEPIK